MRELSLNVLDIAQNSVSANASLIEIELVQSTKDKELLIGIYDNGKGMTKQQLINVQDPFYTTRTTRKVGLGIPLFKMAAEMTGGKLEIESEVGVGTKVRALFRTDSIDFTPVGDICSTVVTLVTMNLHIDFVFKSQVDDRVFLFDTRQIKEILGDVPLNEPGIARWIKDYIDENINTEV